MTEVSTNYSSTSSSASVSQLNTDFDQFLRLLTTQLQNQDPLSPMETQEFTQQLIGFSQVEQQIKGNDKLDSLLAVQSLNMTALGVSFIGKSVEVQGDTFKASGAKSSTISYTLPETASSGTVSILDKDGNVMYSAPAELTAGTHSVTWDGKDKNGDPVAEGTYTLKVSALTATGTSLNTITYVPGYVSSLESSDTGALVLNVDGKQIPIGNVRKIAEADSI